MSIATNDILMRQNTILSNRVGRLEATIEKLLQRFSVLETSVTHQAQHGDALSNLMFNISDDVDTLRVDHELVAHRVTQLDNYLANEREVVRVPVPPRKRQYDEVADAPISSSSPVAPVSAIPPEEDEVEDEAETDNDEDEDTKASSAVDRHPSGRKKKPCVYCGEMARIDIHIKACRKKNIVEWPLLGTDEELTTATLEKEVSFYTNRNDRVMVKSLRTQFERKDFPHFAKAEKAKRQFESEKKRLMELKERPAKKAKK